MLRVIATASHQYSNIVSTGNTIVNSATDGQIN